MQITHILDNGPHHCSAVHPIYMARSTILSTRICYNLILCATYRKSMQVEQLVGGGKTDLQKSQQNIR